MSQHTDKPHGSRRESSFVVRPESPGSASYTAANRLEAAGLRRAISQFERVAATVAVPAPPQPIVIADYGASAGYNSLLPIGAAIAVLRRRTQPDHAVFVAHTDLPGNDFTALFRTLGEDPDSYLLKDAACYPAAIGRSFYSQLLPSASVTLGWTSWATMWLTRGPDELPEVPDHILVSYSADAAARSAYARQAARDWQAFVAFRGRELSPGGKLLVLSTAVGEHGQLGYGLLVDAIVAVLDELVRDGALTQDEVGRMTIPVFFRSEGDFRAPFAPSGRFEQLSIESLELFNGDDRFWKRFSVDGDARAFGAQWAAFARAAVFPVLVAALGGGPGDPRIVDLMRRLEAGVAQRLASAPQQMQIPLALVVLAKAAESS